MEFAHQDNLKVHDQLVKDEPGCVMRSMGTEGVFLHVRVSI
ncbi:hypothetical protein MCP1_240043 [Candidatus Terasakiella magnetica]|nr:hypothetical protein MCP1_240043 [Candidatus Terasakiella magnetica]